MNYEKAVRLKKAGLTGITISLDHFDKSSHDTFRGSAKSYDWAIEALKHSKVNGLFTCLSICVTRDFVSHENLMSYLNLAKKKGSDFIRILEPQPVGNYKNKAVKLDETHIQVLEKFYLEVSSNPEFDNYPLVVYPGYHQRKIGCLGGGNRFLYVDSDGKVHSCPFCADSFGSSKQGLVMDDDQKKCKQFEFSSI